MRLRRYLLSTAILSLFGAALVAAGPARAADMAVKAPYS
jgi:hypothetical protein